MYKKFFIDYQDYTQNIVYFFCSEFFGEVYENIVNEFTKTLNNENHDFISEPNWLSLSSFEQFLSAQDNSSVTRGISQTIIDALVNLKILFVSREGNNLYYKGNYKLFQKLSNPNLVFNLIFGENYTVKINKVNIFKIETKNSHGDIGIGTGFSLNIDAGEERRSVIITCQHVAQEIVKILDIKSNEIKFGKIHHHSNFDISIIELPELIFSSTCLENAVEIPDKVITMGFPIVPRTQDAYLMSHKGEVNSFVKDTQNIDYFLFSAKTSSGNSGSPVFDYLGRVIGMVTSEFFSRDEFKEKGKSPYYAAILSRDILTFLRKMYEYSPILPNENKGSELTLGIYFKSTSNVFLMKPKEECNNNVKKKV